MNTPPPDWMQTHPAMADAWRRSWETLRIARELLCDGNIDERIATIAVAGSLGRLELSPSSDLDLIVVLREPTSDDVNHRVWNALRPLELRLPKPDGIYGRAVTISQLVSRESLGVIDEDKATFGQRMQLLIESRALWNEPALTQLQREILERFTDDVAVETIQRWRPLIDDLLRYHRSLCVHYARLQRERLPGWRDLVDKAGHSRLAGIAGLLFLLAESTRAVDDALSFVVDRLPLTPLERIAMVGRSGFETITACYARFLNSLQSTKGDPVDLTENAATFKCELLRLLFDRFEQGLWPPALLEALVL